MDFNTTRVLLQPVCLALYAGMLAGCAVGKRKMLCVGCPTEAFHTLEDVARVYGIAMEQLLRELREAINSSGNNE